MTGYLLDTCAISDGRKPQHYPKLATWLATVEPEQTYLSVATIAEIQFGVARHEDDKQRAILGSWLLKIIDVFDKRIIELDVSVACSWGLLRHALERAGAPYSPVDAIIAATALRRELTIVTRNVRHFERAGADVLNPW
ncbi:MAG: type II toxin-antitoxin system VapC family toxin [Candidatus Velthaea sp.]